MPTFEFKENRPIIVISLITAVCLVGDSMLYVALPTHWEEIGLSSLWQVGIILSVNRLVRLPLNPLVGWLYSKIDTRTGLLAATFLAFITTLSYGFINDFVQLIILRCVWGLAWTILRLGAYYTLVDLSTNQNRGKNMGLYNGLYRLGSLFGMLIGGILADIYGLKNTALFFSLITLLSIPLAYMLIKKSSHSQVKIPEQSKKKIDFSFMKDGNALSILLVGLLVAMIFQGMFTSTLSYLVEKHNSSIIPFFGLMIGASSLAGILQAIRWSWEPWLAPWFGSLTDGKHGRYPVLLGSTLTASILFALVPFDMPMGLWLCLLLILQLTATSLTTTADALAADVAAKSANFKVMTAYSLFIDIGAALGPIAAYLMNQHLNPYASYWGASVILLIVTFRFMNKIKISRTV